MPLNPRVRGNNVFGTVSDSPLTAASATMNSLGLSNLPVVITQHATITLDPLRQFGNPEIVVVTVHTSGATVVTITRGTYGTSAREHPSGTLWVHAPLDEDFIEIVTSVTHPSDPYRGQMIFESDTDKFVARSQSDTWIDAIPLGQWIPYIPTLTQNAGVVTKTVNYARYARVGRFIVVNVMLTVTGAGAVGAIEVGLPISSALTGNLSIGNFYVADASTAPFNFHGIAAPTGALVVRGITNGNAQYLGVAASAMPNALAAPDVLSVSVTYEAVS